MQCAEAIPGISIVVSDREKLNDFISDIDNPAGLDQFGMTSFKSPNGKPVMEIKWKNESTDQ